MTLLGVKYVCNLRDPTRDLTLFRFVHHRLPRFPEKIPWNGTPVGGFPTRPTHGAVF